MIQCLLLLNKLQNSTVNLQTKLTKQFLIQNNQNNSTNLHKTILILILTCSTLKRPSSQPSQRILYKNSTPYWSKTFSNFQNCLFNFSILKKVRNFDIFYFFTPSFVPVPSNDCVHFYFFSTIPTKLFYLISTWL